jgi:hypothetical protein
MGRNFSFTPCSTATTVRICRPVCSRQRGDVHARSAVALLRCGQSEGVLEVQQSLRIAFVAEALICAVHWNAKRKGARSRGLVLDKQHPKPEHPEHRSQRYRINPFLARADAILAQQFAGVPLGSPASRSISARDNANSSARARQISMKPL